MGGMRRSASTRNPQKASFAVSSPPVIANTSRVCAQLRPTEIRDSGGRCSTVVVSYAATLRAPLPRLRLIIIGRPAKAEIPLSLLSVVGRYRSHATCVPNGYALLKGRTPFKRPQNGDFFLYIGRAQALRFHCLNLNVCFRSQIDIHLKEYISIVKLFLSQKRPPRPLVVSRAHTHTHLFCRKFCSRFVECPRTELRKTNVTFNLCPCTSSTLITLNRNSLEKQYFISNVKPRF